MKGDGVTVLPVLRPKGMTSPHLDLSAQVGNRRNIAADAQFSAYVRSEDVKGIPVSGRYPGPVACLL